MEKGIRSEMAAKLHAPFLMVVIKSQRVKKQKTNCAVATVSGGISSLVADPISFLLCL